MFDETRTQTTHVIRTPNGEGYVANSDHIAKSHVQFFSAASPKSTIFPKLADLA